MKTGLRPIRSASRPNIGWVKSATTLAATTSHRVIDSLTPTSTPYAMARLPKTVETAAMKAQQITRSTSRQWSRSRSRTGSLEIWSLALASANDGGSWRLRRMK